MTVFTIGFTQKSAEDFFTRLRSAGVKRLLDVRLNNKSQLAGFAKKDDLEYFLRAINSIDYLHLPDLAPTQEMLDAYKKSKGAWSDYERQFLALMTSRRIETSVGSAVLDGGCLLCSEDKPDHCHRRLVVEYLQAKLGGIAVQHL